MVRLQRLCRPRQNSLSTRHPQMGAACFARTILKVFKFSHSLSPTLRLLFSRKAAAMAILSESGKSISSEICQSLFFYFLTSPAHLSFCSCPCSCRTSRNNHHHCSHGRKMQRLTTLQVHLNISGKQSCSLSATAGTMNTQHLSESLPSPKSRSKLSKSGLLYGLVAAA